MKGTKPWIRGDEVQKRMADSSWDGTMARRVAGESIRRRRRAYAWITVGVLAASLLATPAIPEVRWEIEALWGGQTSTLATAWFEVAAPGVLP